MSDGLTTYWTKDAAWWRRGRVVELGQEHGPAGPAVVDWLISEARTQGPIRGHDGSVKSAYAAVAHGCFLRGGADEARAVIATAVEVGLLDDFMEQGRSFTCRISGWRTEIDRPTVAEIRAQQRAREAERNGQATAGDTERHQATASDVPADLGLLSPNVPLDGDGDGDGELSSNEERDAGVRPLVVTLGSGKHRQKATPEQIQLAVRLLDVFNQAVGSKLKPTNTAGAVSDTLKRFAQAVMKHDDVSGDEWERGIRSMVSDPPSWATDGISTPGQVLGGNAIETTLQRARSNVRPLTPKPASSDGRPDQDRRIAKLLAASQPAPAEREAS